MNWTILFIWSLTIKISLRAFGILHEWFIIVIVTSLFFWQLQMLIDNSPIKKGDFQVVSFYGYTMVNDLIGQDKKITNDIKLLLKPASFDQEKTHKNKEMIRTPGVSKSRYFDISISIKYSNFSRFYKKKGPFYKKFRCDKFCNWSISTRGLLPSKNDEFHETRGLLP